MMPLLMDTTYRVKKIPKVCFCFKWAGMMPWFVYLPWYVLMQSWIEKIKPTSAECKVVFYMEKNLGRTKAPGCIYIYIYERAVLPPGPKPDIDDSHEQEKFPFVFLVTVVTFWTCNDLRTTSERPPKTYPTSLRIQKRNDGRWDFEEDQIQRLSGYRWSEVTTTFSWPPWTTWGCQVILRNAMMDEGISKKIKWKGYPDLNGRKPLERLWRPWNTKACQVIWRNTRGIQRNTKASEEYGTNTKE